MTIQVRTLGRPSLVGRAGLVASFWNSGPIAGRHDQPSLLGEYTGAWYWASELGACLLPVELGASGGLVLWQLDF